MKYVVMSNTATVFYQFLYRDFYGYRKRLYALFIDTCLIYPVLYGISWGFLRPALLFNGDITTGTSMYVGNIVMIMMLLSMRIVMPMIVDLETTRFMYYQMSLLNPRLLIFERIVFNTLFTYALAAPFFPLTKLLLGNYLYTHCVSWPTFFGLLFLSSYVLAAYHTCMACIITPRSMGNIWARFNWPMLALGGIWAPWYIMHQFSPTLGIIAYANPIVYITEGLRQIIIGGDQFLSVSICVSALSGFALLFTILAWYLFKKRVDHI